MPLTSNPDLQRVLEELSAALSAARIPHAVVGGLAVNSYGYERATKDIDLLVRSKDLEKLRKVLGHVGAQSMPAPRTAARAVYHGTTVDLLYVSATEKALDSELRAPLLRQVPVISAGGLFYLKLLSTRAKDWADIVELLKLDPTMLGSGQIFLYKLNRGDLVAKLRDAQAKALAEIAEIQ